MFIIINGKVYSATYDVAHSRYPLVSVKRDAATGAITITDEGEGIATLPAVYYRASLEEVIAIFNVVGGNYAPPATLTGNDPVTIYLDETNKVVTITAANPSSGTFSDVKSDDTDVATVSASGGTVTIVPVTAGECNVTIKFTPTDEDFAASVVTVPVTVARRKIEIDQIRNFSLKKNTTRDVTLVSNVAGIAYTVLSSDTGICAVSETSGTLTLTPAETAPLGTVTITVAATLASGKADASAVMRFRVRVCDNAVTITTVDPVTLELDEVKKVTVVCAGAEIREVASSDPTKVAVEKTGKLEITLTALGADQDTADITVYCDKRGYGEDAETFTVTLSDAA